MAFDINDTSPRDQYTAAGAQTVFTISFEFLENADIKAYLTPVGSDPDDTADLLTLTTHYTLIGAGVNTAKTLTLVAGATAGDVVTIVRDAGVDRDTEFLSNGDLTISAMNLELDKIITLIQQTEMNQEQRSLMFKRAAQLAGISMVMPDPIANSFLGWNNAGTGLTLTENFDSLYLGAKATAPATDNEGGALAAGMLYFNTASDDLWFYTGAAWQLYNSSAASSANTVSIADAGGYYGPATEVETALQEIGARFNDFGGLKTKLITWSGWDMNTDAEKIVSHGLDYTKIRGITGLVGWGSNPQTKDFHYKNNGGSESGEHGLYVIASFVHMRRETNGYFDNVLYSTASGWLIIQYID